MSILVNFLVLAGALFAFIAALGLVRLPDFYCRMHAAAKAGSLGGSLFLLAAALALGGVGIWLQVLLTILFFYLTTPVASHLLGRVARQRNTPLYQPHRPPPPNQSPQP